MRIRVGLPLVLLLGLVTCGLGRCSELALVGSKIYPSPTEPPIENGAVIIQDGRIVAFGPSASVKIPHEALAGKRLWALDIELEIVLGREELEAMLSQIAARIANYHSQSQSSTERSRE